MESLNRKRDLSEQKGTIDQETIEELINLTVC